MATRQNLTVWCLCCVWVPGCSCCLAGSRLTGTTMKEVEVRRLFAANLLCVFSVILTAVVPAFLWDGFTVLGTHLAWLCICSVCVGTVNVILHLVLKPNRSPKRSSLAHKVRFLMLNSYQMVWRGSKCCHCNNQIRKRGQFLLVNSCFPWMSWA